jgi:hypothetical protein
VTSAVGGNHLPESLSGPCRCLCYHELNTHKVTKIRSPIGLVVGSCTSHPGVLGSIPKREEPGKTGAPCVKVPGSSRVPHANSFVIGPAVIKHTHWGRPRKSIIFHWHVCCSASGGWPGGYPPLADSETPTDSTITVTDALQSTTFRLYSSTRPSDRGGGTETPAASVPRHEVQARHARYSEIRNPFLRKGIVLSNTVS